MPLLHLLTAAPTGLDQAEQVQKMFGLDPVTAVAALCVVATASIFSILMTVFWRAGRRERSRAERAELEVAKLQGELKRARAELVERSDEFNAKLDEARKEHMATLVEAQFAQRAMLELKDELKTQLLAAARPPPGGRGGRKPPAIAPAAPLAALPEGGNKEGSGC